MVNPLSMCQMMKERLITEAKKGVVARVEKVVAHDTVQCSEKGKSGSEKPKKRKPEGSGKKHSSHKKSKISVEERSKVDDVQDDPETKETKADSGDDESDEEVEVADDQIDTDNIDAERSVQKVGGSAVGAITFGDLSGQKPSGSVEDGIVGGDNLIVPRSERGKGLHYDEEAEDLHSVSPFLSVAKGQREAIKHLTKPEGGQGWSFLDIRTLDEWTSEDGGNAPIDCLKVFDIPVDRMRYEAMGDREFLNQFSAYNGEAMSRNVFAVRRMNDLIRRVEKAEKELEKKEADFEGKFKAEEAVRIAAEQRASEVEQQNASLEVKLTEAENNLKKSEKDLGDERIKVSGLEEEKFQLNKDLEAARNINESNARENERLKKLANAEYKENVRVFLHTQGCNDYVNWRASRVMKMGYECCMEWVGDGEVLDFKKHDALSFSQWAEKEEETYLAMDAFKNADPDPTPTANPRYEIPRKELTLMEESDLKEPFASEC